MSSPDSSQGFSINELDELFAILQRRPSPALTTIPHERPGHLTPAPLSCRDQAALAGIAALRRPAAEV